MRNRILFLSACAFLIGLTASANAIILVMGSGLANDCYRIAKSGVDLQRGLATCDSALEDQALNPHDRAGTMINRGTMEFALKRIDAAVTDFNNGIALYPNLPEAYVNRGGAYILQKRLDEAMVDINHGIDLGLSDPVVGYYNRAVAEQLQGKFKEAYFDYKKALELQPNYAPAKERLGDFVVTRVPTKTLGG